MVFSRSFFSISLLALPILVVGCGDPADDGEMTTSTATTTVTPPTPPPVTPSTPPANPPPVTPSTPPANPPPVTPSTPPANPPPATDTWAPVYAIFQAKCDSGVCHGADDPFMKLIGDTATVQTTAAAGKDKIVRRTITVGDMPPAGTATLTDDEKAAIQAWADSL